MKKLCLALLCMALATCGRPPAKDHGHEPEEKGGDAKAVLEASEEKGFRLSPLAIQTLGIETATLKHGKTAEIPAAARVYFQDEIGVYRLRDGWFRLVHLDDPEALRAGDAIAVRGAAYLRVTDISLFGEGLAGHHH